MNTALKRLLLCGILAVSLCSVHAEVLLAWDFELNSTENAAIPSSLNAEHILPSTFTAAGPLTAAPNRINSAVYRNVATATTVEEAVLNNSYVEFSVTAEAGYVFDLSTVQLRISSFNSPKGAPAFSIRTSLDDFAEGDEIIPLFAANASSVPLHTLYATAFNDLTTLTFRIYVFDPSGEGNAYSTYLGFGEASIETAQHDIIIEGQVKPASE
jgi:hypothetical protein